MDSVRFGRALGFGARSAAKAVAGAIDAATAPAPGTPRSATAPPGQTDPPRSAQPSARPASRPVASAARTAARATVRARETREGIARGSRRFGEAVWGPFIKLSGVLWLEITGSFFAIFALFAGHAAWDHRADLQATATNHDSRLHLLLFVGMALVFGYFCISSFVRAYRK